MIPRYRPRSDLGALVAGLRSDPVVARTDIALRLGLDGFPHLLPFVSARAALDGWLEALARRTSARRLILSAQICPIVPRMAVRRGFVPCFVDIDPALPTPSMATLLAARTQDVAATVVSPMYGHAAPDADALTEGPGEIVLDLAQALLHEAFLPVTPRVDAVVFSFGVGKGLDAGGGLLAARTPGDAGPKGPSSPTGVAAKAWLRGAAVNGAVAMGLWRAAAASIDPDASVREAMPDEARQISAAAFGAWARSLGAFAEEVAVARRRAAALHATPQARAACLYAECYGGAASTHLRQVLRLRDARKRDETLVALQRLGIDANPAGEPLPGAYLARETYTVAPGFESFPNAARFRTDAIRLPFLGRLTEVQWRRVADAVATVLGEGA